MKTFLHRIACACLIGLALIAAYLIQLQTSRNFHPVIAGEAYRSAQPVGDDLRNWVEETGIRSVVNLRGSHQGAPWYDAEIRTSQELGLPHYDFRMSASKGLDPQRAAELIALLRDAPKPVLIHCKAGADRTGLAAALYLADRGHGEERAEAQISIRYGHVSLPYTAAWPIDQSWEMLEDWLGYAS